MLSTNFSFAMKGIRPMGIALIALAALSLTNSDNFTDYLSPVLFIAAFICFFIKTNSNVLE